LWTCRSPLSLFFLTIFAAASINSAMKYSKTAGRLHRLLKKDPLWDRGARLLVAFSGGVDSTALVRLLLEIQPLWKHQLHLLHFDHGLRPGADAMENRWCRAYSEKVGLPYSEESLPVRDYAARSRLGIEGSARVLRYESLREKRRLLGADCILTAHHRDDQAETVLYRLFTGTGEQGLQGIHRRSAEIVRPLLEFSRKELADYLLEIGQDCLHDESNSDRTYLRNRIRHDILPFIADQGFENAAYNLARAAAAVQRSRSLIRRLVLDQLLDTKAENGVYLALPRELLLTFSPRQQVEFIAIAAPRDLPKRLTEKQLTDAVNLLADSQTGAHLQFSDELHCSLDRDKLLFHKPSAEWSPITLTGEGSWQIPGVGTVELESPCKAVDFKNNGELKAWFPVEILMKELTLRPWRTGERMAPRGSRGSQLLSELLTKAKIPVLRRKYYPVLCSGEDILWIPGVRRSRLHELSAGNKAVICLNFRIET